MIFNIQNRDKLCLRWSIRAALFPAPRGNLKKKETDKIWLSQIDKLEKQNQNFAINVFEWEKEHVIVHRISKKDGAIPKRNVIITQQGDNTLYWLAVLLYD